MHLGRVGLGVVPIEVEVLRGRAPAHLLGSVLVRTIPAAEALVSIHVEHRHEDQNERLERIGSRRAFKELSDRQKSGILAVYLTRVDSALHQQHRQVALARSGGGQRPGSGNGERKHRPSLRCTTELQAANSVLPPVGVSGTQTLDLIIATGTLEPGSLRQGGEIGVGARIRLRARRRERDEDEQRAE